VLTEKYSGMVEVLGMLNVLVSPVDSARALHVESLMSAITMLDTVVCDAVESISFPGPSTSISPSSLSDVFRERQRAASRRHYYKHRQARVEKVQQRAQKCVFIYSYLSLPQIRIV
jgi:hypothetical protein